MIYTSLQKAQQKGHKQLAVLIDPDKLDKVDLEMPERAATWSSVQPLAWRMLRKRLPTGPGFLVLAMLLPAWWNEDSRRSELERNRFR